MAITVGNTTQMAASSGAGPFTFSHNNNGDFLVVLVAVRDDANNTLAVTYNGASLTSALNHVLTGGSTLEVQIFIITNPASGSNTVSISSSGSIGSVIGAGAISVSGVNEGDYSDATAVDDEAPGGGAGEDPRTTSIVTSTAGALIIDAIADRSAGLTVGGSQTQIFNVGTGDKMAGSYRTTTTPGSYAMEWDPTENGEDWAQAIIALKPAGTSHSSTLDEVVTLVDTRINQPTKLLSDVVTLVDSLVRTSARILTDILTIVDSALKTPIRTLSDVVTLVDTLIKTPTKLLTDVVTVVDSILKTVVKLLSEVVTIIDVIIKSFTRTLSDVITMVDTITSDVVSGVSDAIVKVLTETIRIRGSFFYKFIRSGANWVKTTVSAASWTKHTPDDADWERN